MKLNEQIFRIKKIMNLQESQKPTTNVVLEGNTTDSFGKKIKIVDNDENLIGYANIVSFDNARELDYDIPRLYEEKNWCIKNCDDNFFNSDNSTYIYDVYVNENFRGNGYGKQVMNLAHDLSKEDGFKYCTLITHRENNTAQNLYKNLGYDLHYSDDTKDFYFLEL